MQNFLLKLVFSTIISRVRDENYPNSKLVLTLSKVMPEQLAIAIVHTIALYVIS